ncbi:MAG: hypothetical protein KKD44_27015 [Proteobacteria bacterium]|nr:hypothetical protein [Pseudomonadota bacterium]
MTSDSKYTTQDTFSEFGNGFQNKIVQAILYDYSFFEKMYDILQERYFSSEGHKLIWREIRKYYEKYNNLPTFESIKIEISCYPESDSKQSTLEIISDIEKKGNRDEIEHAKDKAFEFCKNKAMEKAILKSAELLKYGKFDEIQKEIEDALKISIELDIGHNYFEKFKERNKNIVRRGCIPTGFDVLDHEDFLEGGPCPGELLVVIAPSGGGKSFFLVNIGFGALAAGKNVLQYTFELSESNIGVRYDSRITGIPIKQIKHNIEEAEKRLKGFKGGKLIIKEYPTKSASVNTLKFHLGRLRTSGFNPDLVIVDYPDLMKSRKGYEMKRFELESIYEDLRGFGKEEGVPVWVVSQTNRGGINSDIITEEMIGEAYAKVQVADFVGSLSMKNFFIIKNRIGMAKKVFPIKIDPTKSLIEIMDPYETSNIDEIIQHSERNETKILKEVYKKFRDNKGLDQ